MLTETKNLLLNVVQLVKTDLKLLDSVTAGEKIIRKEVLD